MGFKDISECEITAPISYRDFMNFKIVLKEPIYTEGEINKMKKDHEKFMNKLREEHRKSFRIGNIVKVYDIGNMHTFFNELFFVIGFQLDIDGKELVVALMDNKYKTFLVNIDHAFVQETLTIDHMFPPRIKNKLMRDRA